MNDDSVWEATLDKASCKQLNSNILLRFYDKRFREQILCDFIDGRYKISPPRKVMIPKKKKGTFRTILVNTQQDRILLSVFYSALMMKYSKMIDPACVSYRVGISIANITRTIVDVIKQVRSSSLSERVVVVKLDIQSYFDSVSTEVVQQLFDEISMCESDNNSKKLLGEIKDYYSSTEVVDSESGTIFNLETKGLAQGCAIGAFLADVVLRKLDKRLRESSVYYIRYSDDILLLTMDPYGAASIIAEELNYTGLSLNYDKLHVLSLDDFEFLGARVVTDGVRMSKEAIDKVKDMVRAETRCSRKNKGDITVLSNAINRIKHKLFYFDEFDVGSGWIGYYYGLCTIDADFMDLDKFIKDRLRRMYTGNSNVTYNLHKVRNNLLCDNGYVSLLHMMKIYRMGRCLYLAEVRRVTLSGGNISVLNFTKQKIQVCDYREISNLNYFETVMNFLVSKYIKSIMLQDEKLTPEQAWIAARLPRCSLRGMSLLGKFSAASRKEVLDSIIEFLFVAREQGIWNKCYGKDKFFVQLEIETGQKWILYRELVDGPQHDVSGYN